MGQNNRVPLTILTHPLALHLLAELRDCGTQPGVFRRASNQLTSMLALEATRSIPTRPRVVETPLEPCEQQVLDQGLVVVPVLRAGLGMLEPIVQMFPDVAVGYIGLERDHTTAIAKGYYCKLPGLANRFTLCVDPMLATGGSASQALSLIKEHGGRKVVMVSVVAAPEGVSRLEAEHPEVEIVTAALDRELDARKYILPGLGDFGDRLYGTP